jgi:ribosomal protein S12 methylthiotransferase accessory factor
MHEWLNTRLAEGVRLFLTKEAAIIATRKGSFRLTGKSCPELLIESLPFLQNQVAVTDWPGSTLSWIEACGSELFSIGFLEKSERAADFSRSVQMSVFVPRRTGLTDKICEILQRHGHTISSSEAACGAVLCDMSRISREEAVEQTRRIQGLPARAFHIECSSARQSYGPFTEHLRTACWNCYRLRRSVWIPPDSRPTEESELEAASIVAQNIALYAMFPKLAPLGCLLLRTGLDNESVHPVMPVPWCEICHGHTDGTELSSFKMAAGEQLPKALQMLTDNVCGVVQEIAIYEPNRTDEPRVPICTSAKAFIREYYRDGADISVGGEGKGLTIARALASAIGEAIERYSAKLWSTATLRRASSSELGSLAFDPRQLVLYEESQYSSSEFRYCRFDPDQKIYWAEGQWLDTLETVYVPALATYLDFPASDSERFVQVTSSGLAAAGSSEEATLKALCELVERDAFMTHWLAELPGKRVSAEGLSPEMNEVICEVQRCGAEIELYLLDDGLGIPTIVCLGIGDGSHWPGLTIGLACHPDPDVALSSAVLEHTHCGAYIRRLMEEGKHLSVSNPEDVQSALDHALFYVDPGKRNLLNFLRQETGDSCSMAELNERYAGDQSTSACVSRLAQTGIRVAAVDVTSPDIKLTPTRVVRTVGTHLQPLAFGTAYYRACNQRLQTFLSRPVNLNPHPIC